MDEFALIRRYFAELCPPRADVALGIGDDAALLELPAGGVLAVSTDTLVAGRHFPQHAPAYDIGWKALAANLSDLAAMGAEPRWFLLSLVLPKADEAWLEGFADGLRAMAGTCGIALVGGDTDRGPLTVSITVLGSVPEAGALRRDGAQVGDLVCVTGTLGDAALALRRIDDPALPEILHARLAHPLPRLEAGRALRGLAHAAIDISDGLAGDLAHVLDASEVGAVIRAVDLPASGEFTALCPPGDRAALQLTGGDDYELCVCLPPGNLEPARDALDVPLTVIGHIVESGGLQILGPDGRPLSAAPQGYRHFE